MTYSTTEQQPEPTRSERSDMDELERLLNEVQYMPEGPETTRALIRIVELLSKENKQLGKSVDSLKRQVAELEERGVFNRTKRAVGKGASLVIENAKDVTQGTIKQLETTGKFIARHSFLEMRWAYKLRELDVEYLGISMRQLRKAIRITDFDDLTDKQKKAIARFLLSVTDDRNDRYELCLDKIKQNNPDIVDENKKQSKEFVQKVKERGAKEALHCWWLLNQEFFFKSGLIKPKTSSPASTPSPTPDTGLPTQSAVVSSPTSITPPPDGGLATGQGNLDVTNQATVESTPLENLKQKIIDTIKKINLDSLLQNDEQKTEFIDWVNNNYYRVISIILEILSVLNNNAKDITVADNFIFQKTQSGRYKPEMIAAMIIIKLKQMSQENIINSLNKLSDENKAKITEIINLLSE